LMHIGSRFSCHFLSGPLTPVLGGEGWDGLMKVRVLSSSRFCCAQILVGSAGTPADHLTRQLQAHEICRPKWSAGVPADPTNSTRSSIHWRKQIISSHTAESTPKRCIFIRPGLG